MDEKERRLAILPIEGGPEVLARADRAAVDLLDDVARLQLALGCETRRIHVGDEDALRAARHAGFLRQVWRERLDAHAEPAFTAAFGRRRRTLSLRVELSDRGPQRLLLPAPQHFERHSRSRRGRRDRITKLVVV